MSVRFVIAELRKARVARVELCLFIVFCDVVCRFTAKVHTHRRRRTRVRRNLQNMVFISLHTYTHMAHSDAAFIGARPPSPMQVLRRSRVCAIFYVSIVWCYVCVLRGMVVAPTQHLTTITLFCLIQSRGCGCSAPPPSGTELVESELAQG